MPELYIDKKRNNNPKTLVFLHGNSSSCKAFDAFFKHHGSYTLCRFDLPGHGQSKGFEPDDYAIPKLRDTVKNTISSSVKEDMILIGNSLGGHLAIEVVPDLENCKGLIIFGTPPVKKPLNLEEAFLPTEALGTYFQEEVSDEELATTMNLVTNQKVVRDQLTSDFRRTDPKFRSTFYESGAVNGDLLDEHNIIESLEIPVFVIHGKQDPSVNIEYVKSINGIQRVYEIDNCGHYPSLEQPERFQNIVEEIADLVFG